MKLNNYEIESLVGKEIPTILQLSTSIKLKYLLNKIALSLKSNYESFTTVKAEIFKRYAHLDDNDTPIIRYDSQEYIQYTNELDEIAKDGVEIDIKIPLSLVENINTTGNFPILFQLIDQEQ